MSIPELLKKIAFTLGLLCIYRIGFHIPLPGVNGEALAQQMGGQDESSPFGQAIQYFGMFTGGALDNSTLFGLGIMPYISASIILQLLTTVVPSLQKLQKEGQAGRKKIQEYTRYLTIALCLVQAAVWMKVMMAMGADSDLPIIYRSHAGAFSVFFMGVMGLTAGTCFLMWLGEQIDEYGIGNGISLLIMAGILARLPFAIGNLCEMASFDVTSGGGKGKIGPVEILFLIASFIFVVAGAILITQGQRRIPIQQAKQTRGRRVYGGQRHYMPLRVNHGGVMPIIFASSLMIFPSLLFGWLSGAFPQSATLSWFRSAFSSGSFTYEIFYVGMIFFFAYFWTSVIFRPKEMAEQLRDMGHFIPGLRPGKRTADYLERVMERITYCGAAFLSIIAVIPTVVHSSMGIPFQVSAFLGGTGLLIVVSVCLDLVQRIESNLVMRNYGGFLGGSTRIKGAYS
ncbi:MAG: preprotein translocase subunit SecY [Planctomycetes bacterium]|nr:preprotein translocase subunit SecY [Planctomycetota bacterium]